MRLPVLVAVTGPDEARLVADLAGAASDAQVVRRCADVGELLSAAAAGVAVAAVVSADLPRFDRQAVVRLRGSGVATVILDPDPGGARVARLDVSQAVPTGASSDVVVAAVTAAVRALSSSGDTSSWAGARVEDDPADRSPIFTGLTEGLHLGPALVDRNPVDPNPVDRNPDDRNPVDRVPGGPAGPEVARRPAVRPLTAPDRDLADPGAALPARPPVPPSVPLPLPAPDGDGRVIAVWGPVGAPGRTTVAVTLAAELAALGRRVLLADADTYGASIAQTLGLLDESAGLASAARAANQGRLDAERLAALAPRVTEGLRVLTGLPQPRRWPELRPSALDAVWAECRRAADDTVIDAGPGLDADEELMFDTVAPRRNGATLSAIATADLIVAVGAAEPIGLQRFLAALPDLRDLAGDRAPVRVVVTRVRDSAVGGPAEDRVRSALRRYAGIGDVLLVPDDRPALDAAMLAGRSLTEHAPRSPARLALAGLAADLVAGRTAGPPRRRRIRDLLGR